MNTLKTLAVAALLAVSVPASAGVCTRGCGSTDEPNGTLLNGITYNGAVWNGLGLNGYSWNGRQMQGTAWNGIRANGAVWNGFRANGLVVNGFGLNGAVGTGIEAGTVFAVTLPDAADHQ